MKLKNWIKPDYCLNDTGSDAKLKNWLEVEVLEEHSGVVLDDSPEEEAKAVAFYRDCPFPHRNIHSWVLLANGKAVGFNENPSTGWSYPHKTYRAKRQVKN